MCRESVETPSARDYRGCRDAAARECSRVLVHVEDAVWTIRRTDDVLEVVVGDEQFTAVIGERHEIDIPPAAVRIGKYHRLGQLNQLDDQYKRALPDLTFGRLVSQCGPPRSDVEFVLRDVAVPKYPAS